MQKRQVKLGETLAGLVKARSISRSEVAEKVGVSESALSQWTHDKSRPEFETLIELAEYFDVDLDYLVFGASPRATHAADYGPAVRYVHRELADLQANLARQNRLFGRLTGVLANKLRQEAERLASEKVSHGGIITDDEMLLLESYSIDTAIVPMQLENDVIRQDGRDAAGRFLPVVAGNIGQGRKYRFLLPRHVGDWTTFVRSYRRLLDDLCNNHELVLRNCVFAVTEAKFFSGCGIYRLALDALESEQPVLYTRLREWLIADRIGFAIAASPSLRADSLMDSFHLRYAIPSFDEVWKKAQPVK